MTNTKSIPIAFLLLTALAINSLNAVSQDSNQVVTAIELEKMNVLYLGIDNPVKIAVTGIEASELKISIENGTINGADGVYLVRPDSLGESVITISHKGKEIRKTKYRVKSFGSPEIVFIMNHEDKNKYFCIPDNNEVFYDQLTLSPGLEAIIKGCDYDYGYEIISFSITTRNKDSIYTVAPSNSNMFTSKQKNILSHLVEGDYFMIDDIKVKDPEGNIHNLSMIMLKIVARVD